MASPYNSKACENEMSWETALRGLIASSIVVVIVAIVPLTPVIAQEPDQPSVWSVQPGLISGPDRDRLHFVFDEIEPGTTIRDFVFVNNLGANALNLTVYASDALTNSNGGFDLLPANEPPQHVGTWLDLQTNDVSLPGGASAVIPFELTVPPHTTPGDYAGGVVATLTRTSDVAGENRVAVEYRVGTRIYMRVSGELMPVLEIEELQTNSILSWNPISGSDIEVNYSIYNSGNVRMVAEPVLKVKGPLGLTLREVELPNTPEILPGHRFGQNIELGKLPPLVMLNTELTLDAEPVGAEEVSAFERISRQAAAWSLPISQGVSIAWVALSAYLIWRLRRGRKNTIEMKERYSLMNR